MIEPNKKREKMFIFTNMLYERVKIAQTGRIEEIFFPNKSLLFVLIEVGIEFALVAVEGDDFNGRAEHMKCLLVHWVEFIIVQVQFDKSIEAVEMSTLDGTQEIIVQI